MTRLIVNRHIDYLAFPVTSLVYVTSSGRTHLRKIRISRQWEALPEYKLRLYAT